MMAPQPGVVAASVKCHRWRLRFGQCSSHPIARVSQDDTVHAFPCLPLLRQALVPSGFRLQVSRCPRSLPANSSCLCQGCSTASRGAHFRLIRLTREGYYGTFPLRQLPGPFTVDSFDRVGTRRVTQWYVSSPPPPNRTGGFHRIRLSPFGRSPRTILEASLRIS